MFRFACIPLLLLLTYQLVEGIGYQTIPRDEIPQASRCAGCSKRTLFTIVWGCISTTIICAWTSIHPNIPPREGPVRGTFRRLELMFWTIVAPEILPAWALRQLFAAMTVRNVYNQRKGYKRESHWIWQPRQYHNVSTFDQDMKTQAWTLRHAHFLIMGGFLLVEPPETQVADTERESMLDVEKNVAPSGNQPWPWEGKVTILTLEMLKELVKDPEFRVPVTEDEITDKSKTDALAKIIFILQSSWFILQCIARHAQGLGFTHLELTTTALASFNGFTFLLWWYKPLGVRTPMRVYLNRRLTDAERKAQRDGFKAPRVNLGPSVRNFLKFVWTTICDVILCRGEGNLLVSWFIRLPLFVLILILSPIVIICKAFVVTILDVVTSSYLPANAKSVPTFYVPEHQYSEYWHLFLMAILGSLFGGIHCVGWNFPFPTHTEQKLWRVSALALTVLPTGATAIVFISLGIRKLTKAIVRSTESVPTSLYDDPNTISYIIMFLTLFTYVAARLVLLGQAVALLRDQPPTDFIDVDWTKFYPHMR